jgi:hypothetical protein
VIGSDRWEGLVRLSLDAMKARAIGEHLAVSADGGSIGCPSCGSWWRLLLVLGDVPVCIVCVAAGRRIAHPWASAASQVEGG